MVVNSNFILGDVSLSLEHILDWQDLVNITSSIIFYDREDELVWNYNANGILLGNVAEI